jgi:hypothetical protein
MQAMPADLHLRLQLLLQQPSLATHTLCAPVNLCSVSRMLIAIISAMPFPSRHVYAEETPQWLWCPNSPFATYKACSSIPAGQDTQCKATKGCAVQLSSSSSSGGSAGGSGSSYCTAGVMAKMSQQQQTAWFDRFRALDPSVVGSCESVCYLRGVFSCAGINSLSDNSTAPASRSSSAASHQAGAAKAAQGAAAKGSAAAAVATPRKAACKRNPSCSWSTESRYCSTNLMGSDAWGQAATAAAAQCSGLSKDRYSCEGGSPKGSAAVLAARVQQYKDYQQPASSTACAS